MSDYNQYSFIGGMNLLMDDTHLDDTSYRCGINIRNRYDRLDPIPNSVLDEAAPPGIKQELLTFGNYVILFSGGFAYYRYYTDSGWQKINNFSMSTVAPRYWTCQVPVGTTNYVRQAIAVNNIPSPNAGINVLDIAGAAQGNLPGLLVQDNINQPQFIFLDVNGIPTCRTTQDFSRWSITYTDASNTVVATDANGNPMDYREYVPIGNTMAWVNGILYIASQDTNTIYRSVSGRPLDFVVNVTNLLATSAPFTQFGGGDATTTSYSVGVGSITCLRQLSTGGLFVSASNANFSVTLNTTPNAPTMFGEYLFIRTFLFNATNLSDRTIIDSLGDTKFIDLVGIRSFNAIQQLQNEGRNSQFSSAIQSAMSGIIQDYLYSAAILYNNYEFYAITTSLGAVIAVYDTITSSWSAFDTSQTNGKRIKAFAKIELTIQRLYAITEDDKIYNLYADTTLAVAQVRTCAVNYSTISAYTGRSMRLNDPQKEIKLRWARVLLNNITGNAELIVTPFTNNRQSATPIADKSFVYSTPETPYTGVIQLADTDSMLYNSIFQFPNCEQGWDSYLIIEWSGGSLSQYSIHSDDNTPINPLNSQTIDTQ